MKTGRFVNTALALAVTIAAAGLLLTCRYNGNITGFFAIGDALPLSPLLARDTAWINAGSAGYDGQMFLTLALDPALRNPGTLAALDNPQYRYRRIGYPLLGYMTGLGRAHLIPYALVLINVLGCAAIVLLGSLMMSPPMGARLWAFQPLALLAAPGLWVSLFLSTADLLACVLLVAGLAAMRFRRDALAAVSLCAACFVKEAYLASLLALAAFQFAKGNRRSALWLAPAALLPMGWLAFVRLNIRAGTGGVSENFGIPLVGIAEAVSDVIRREVSAANGFELYCLLVLVAAAAVLVVDVVKAGRALSPENVAMLPLIALLVVSRPQVLDYHGGYLRVFLPLFLVPGLTLSREGNRGCKLILLAMAAVASGAYVLNMIMS